MGFSIDDVRATFTADVTGLIGRLSDTVEKLLGSARLAEDGPPVERAAFDDMADLGHTLAGTTAAVGAHSLTESARLLVETASAGREALRLMEVHAARARALAAACREGAAEMGGMLACELDRRPAEALMFARSWRKMVEAAAAHAPGSVPSETSAHPAAAEFHFDLFSGPQPSKPEARKEFQLDESANMAAAAVSSEVLERFQNEARAALADLEEKLAAARRQPRDTLALAGLPAVAVASGEPAGSKLPADVSKARPLFIAECLGVRTDALALVPGLTGAMPVIAENARTGLDRLFHRLKSSALLGGEGELAAAAETAVQALAAPAHPDRSGDRVRQVEQALAVLTSFLERAGATTEPRSLTATVAREPVTVETDRELWETVQLEWNELIESIEREALDLENSAQPKNGLQNLMRHFHTLKGLVNTIGLHPTGRLVHALETCLENLLEAPILPPLRRVASLVLDVREAVQRNFDQAHEGSVEVLQPRFERRIARLLGAVPAEPSTDSAVAPSTVASEHEDSHRSFREHRSARSQESSTSGSHRGDRIARKFIRVPTEQLDNLMNLTGELVVSRSRLLARAASLKQIQRELGWGSRRLLDNVETFRTEYEFSNLDGKRERPAAAAPGRHAAGADAWSGFGTLELDRYEDIHILSRTLTEITSDLAEVNGQLEKGLASFADDSDSFDKLIAGIRREVTRARMVAAEGLFFRLKLPVRDAATRAGIEVRLAAQGVDVSMDKSIADALFQPLLHLVRNAVVHGIEPVAARELAGKPGVGTITLVARQQAGQIVIEVRDDGAGLDLALLHQRGVAMGLIPPELPPGDPAVRELVFQPGLSTRAEAGEVSGRGLGCDVVWLAVERLGGSIRLESEPGRGTAFLITLPVSLAITRALLVRARGCSYAIPLHFAERIMESSEATFVESAGVRRVRIDAQLVPVWSLSRFFGIADSGETRRASGAVVLLRAGDHRLAIEVDEVAGQEEVVVKNLGPVLTGHALFAGVTIRGSGEMVLILDVASLIQGAQRAPGRARRQQGSGMPRATPDPAVEARAAPENAPAGAGPLRVLFIDDSLSVRKFAETTLRRLGVEVTLGIDGLDALSKLRAGTFDLVFTDLEMPRMHGFELIRELRFMPEYQDLPVIVVTSRSGEKHQQQARALGATDYLTKPFSAAMVEAALERWARRPISGPRPGEGGSP